ncbi:MAG: nuclear transport factor 2 family protein [Actinomycetota bacterium]|nr:nuclear transport factor 2 family protein [Actinomycetota bacterium]
MGEARQVFDKFTAAMTRGDIDEVASLYAEEAVALSPEGELQGRKEIAEYLRPFTEAFSEFRWEPLHDYEDANSALDEGWICGVHTGPLPGPDGQPVAATGKSIRLRECDAVTVEGGLITSHRFYYDQMELLGQLGIIPG